MNDYGTNNDNRGVGGRAEGQDNPAHSHNFSLQRYVADAERNVYLRRPIVNLPEERRPSPSEMPEPQARMQSEAQNPSGNGGQRNEKTDRQKNERVAPHIKRTREDDYIPEPFLGYYPLAGRTTYIGSHKKQANKKLITIVIAVIVIVLAFIIFNFGDAILGFIKGIGKEDDAAAFFRTAISDTYTL